MCLINICLQRSFFVIMGRAMSSPLFQAKTFAIEGSRKCACIITGYRGRTASYKGIIKVLNDKGYSVVAYEHSPQVFTQGNPDLLPVLVTQICDDFSERTAGFDEIICTGASLGAGLCFALQRQIPKVRFGIYAGAGVSPPETIHEAPLFYFVRRSFISLGHDRAKLQTAWAEIDILPDKNFAQTPFVMALGQKDKIVRYDKAVTTIQSWQEKGQPIRIIPKPNLGHIGVIRWYKSHFSELLAMAEGMTAQLHERQSAVHSQEMQRKRF